MALFNFKTQSFLSSLFIKPFNSVISYFSGIFKPKQIIKKEDLKQDNKPYKSNIEMKTISTFPREPKNLTALETCDYLRRQLADLQRRVDVLQSEQVLRNKRSAREIAAEAPKVEKSFVSNILSKVNIFNPKAQIFRHKSLQERLDETSKDKNNSYSRTYGR